MLEDLLRFATLRFPWYLAPMGYVRELAGIGVRNHQSEKAWRGHLAATCGAILEAADRCPRTEKALVMGSGLLLDIPLEELSHRFRQVVLADIVHFRRVRRAARRYPNVTLVQIDVTGIAKAVFDLARRGRPVPLPERSVDLFLDDGFDLVASVNLLSQLPVVPAEYLAAKVGNLPLGAIDEFGRRLVENHLDWLARFPGVVSLIADLERIESDGDTVLTREEMLWDVRLPPGGQTWNWDIGPRPSIRPDRDVRHKVIAFTEFPKAAWLAGRRGVADGTPGL